MEKLIKISKTASTLLRVVYGFIVIGLIVIFIWSDTSSMTVKIRREINSTLFGSIDDTLHKKKYAGYHGVEPQGILRILRKPGVKTSSILSFLNNDQKTSLEQLNKYVSANSDMKINYDYEKKEVDLDGDRKNEIFYMFGARNDNIVLTEQKGRVYYLNFGTFIYSGFIDVLKIKDTRKNVALILSTGTNGLNSELMYLIGLKNGKPEITFCTAESYKCELIDLDKDGVNEILCNSKNYSWPIIYKWSGETFMDSSLSFPEILITSYKELLNTESIGKINESLSSQSKEYKLFWEQNLLPLYKKSNKSESKNIK
ncbi:MAG: hypothetical protein A2231_09350 [Candidatus Firestonebacteria bacterium RIFOXYA2_FULL_40_8]|nr:MAG: hypothetical protein A2231_09350 [Candidatus Firestonebacteria bacterium RIFOXYA2_FULL_40_8]